MQPPRIPVLLDVENRLRCDWRKFADAWQSTAETWKDARRQQFENEHLTELPAVLTRTGVELMKYRELIQRASKSLSDPDAES